jgi:hypothetical protein
MEVQFNPNIVLLLKFLLHPDRIGECHTPTCPITISQCVLVYKINGQTFIQWDWRSLLVYFNCLMIPRRAYCVLNNYNLICDSKVS